MSTSSPLTGAQPAPSDGSPFGEQPTSSRPQESTTVTSSSTAGIINQTGTPPADSGMSMMNNPGAVAGIVIGVMAAVALLIGYIFYRRRRRNDAQRGGGSRRQMRDEEKAATGAAMNRIFTAPLMATRRFNIRSGIFGIGRRNSRASIRSIGDPTLVYTTNKQLRGDGTRPEANNPFSDAAAVVAPHPDLETAQRNADIGPNPFMDPPTNPLAANPPTQGLSLAERAMLRREKERTERQKSALASLQAPEPPAKSEKRKTLSPPVQAQKPRARSKPLPVDPQIRKQEIAAKLDAVALHIEENGSSRSLTPQKLTSADLRGSGIASDVRTSLGDTTESTTSGASNRANGSTSPYADGDERRGLDPDADPRTMTGPTWAFWKGVREAEGRD